MVVVIWSCHKGRYSRPLQIVGVLAILLYAMGWSHDFCKCIAIHYFLMFFYIWISNAWSNRPFMQIVNYRLWLRLGYIGKGPNFASLKLNNATTYEYRKLLVGAKKSYPRAEDLNARDCNLEGIHQTKAWSTIECGLQFTSTWQSALIDFPP